MMSTSVVIAILVCGCTTYSNYGRAFTSTSSLRATSPSSSSSSGRGSSRGSGSRRTFLSSTVVTPVVDETATTTAVVGDATGGTSSSDVFPAPSSSASSPSPAVNWSSKQHLYGVDVTIQDEGDDGTKKTVASFALDADGNERTAAALAVSSSSSSAALPLPRTYVTCGKCSSLFAIAASDLGTKGCRVKCSVCDNTWYQSIDRLFDIPISTHDMMPANKDDLDRISRNIINGCAPNYMGVYKLYVGNLDFTTTSDQLLQFIESNIQQSSSSSTTTTTTTTTEEGGGGSGSKRNKVCDVSLVKGQDGRPRGFAFVSFYDEEDGKKTLISCNGKECNVRELIVKEPNN